MPALPAPSILHNSHRGAKPFMRSRESLSHSGKKLMEPEVSLPCSQEPSTGLYPEPDESSQHPHSNEFIISIYLSIYLSMALQSFCCTMAAFSIS
jgi:hypothetical protein